jgi:hypothetical protein
MGWFLVPVVVILILVVPYFAADSRDGADWKPAALRSPARGTRRTRRFSESPGALLVLRVASRAVASHRRMRPVRPVRTVRPVRRARTSERTRPRAKITGALADRAAER